MKRGVHSVAVQRFFPDRERYAIRVADALLNERHDTAVDWLLIGCQQKGLRTSQHCCDELRRAGNAAGVGEQGHDAYWAEPNHQSVHGAAGACVSQQLPWRARKAWSRANPVIDLAGRYPQFANSDTRAAQYLVLC